MKKLLNRIDIKLKFSTPHLISLSRRFGIFQFKKFHNCHFRNLIQLIQVTDAFLLQGS